jgi:hypothetical protein
LNQQKRSTFVNALAWIFIALAGFATLIAILQNIMITVMFPVEEMNKAFENAQIQEQLPFFAKFMFSNIRLFFASILVVSGTTFISAIGLLKRKNWARLIFIAMMGLGICWNIFSLIIENIMLTSIPDFTQSEMDSHFSTMMNVMKIFTFVFAIGMSYLFAWIIYKLTSLNVKNEFVKSLTIAASGQTREPDLSYFKKRKIIILCSIALSIAIGIFYFSIGNIKMGDRSENIQELAISGDSVKLGELLRKQPHLSNTIRKSDNWTPLHGAACNGKTECVRLLIDAGADVNAQSCNQSTALHCAAEYGHTEIVELLLEADADPNVKDFKGKTPLDWAVWNNHQDIVDLLRKYNAKTGIELQERREGIQS